MNQFTLPEKRLTAKKWSQLNSAYARQDIVEELIRNPKLSVATLSDVCGVSRATLWRWKKRYAAQGFRGLLKDKRSTKPRRISPEVEQKILDLRQKLGYGHQRIALYLKRYMGVNIASSTVWNVFKRNNLPNLYMTRYNKPAKCLMKRYEKEFPGDTIQMDVKFIKNPQKHMKRFYQFTAIDDCTRFRVLRIYTRNTTQNAMDFLEQVKQTFPVAIRQIQTDNGPEFATDFSFHLDRQGIHHRRIKPRTPRLNGKVERSHRTDEEEFYSRQRFEDIQDLKVKLSEWEKHYNLERAHMGLNGQTPVERLQAKLSTDHPRINVAKKTD